jgi:pimeloyl-ACP methyl ester carboxylesterase
MTGHEPREIRLRDGRALAYAEYGQPNGQSIIYCHGAPSSRAEGDLIIDAAILETLGARVIIPDRPGIGGSDPKPARTVLDWADDVQALMNALRIDRCVVVGSSGGSPFALACALRLREHVRAVGLIGCLAPLDAPGMLQALGGPLRLMFRLARSAPAVLRGLYRLQLRAIRRSGAGGGERMASWFPEPDRTLFQRQEIREGFTRCFLEACRRGPEGPVTDMALIARPWGLDLDAIRVPVLLWQGERDRQVPLAHGRYLAAAIPGCQPTFLPDDAHLSVPIQHGREIFSALLQ